MFACTLLVIELTAIVLTLFNVFFGQRRSADVKERTASKQYIPDGRIILFLMHFIHHVPQLSQ
jgi:hypothetical protein